MHISKLIVIIGDHQNCLNDCTDENPDVAELLKAATSSRAEITITVPQSPETASALGRLVFGKSKAEVISVFNAADLIPALSRRLEHIDLPARAARALLQNAKYEYVWQVAEHSRTSILKIKDIGGKSAEDIKVVLKALGIEMGMDLSSIKDRLPQPS